MEEVFIWLRHPIIAAAPLVRAIRIRSYGNDRRWQVKQVSIERQKRDLKLAWGIAPGIQITTKTSAESANQLTSRFELLREVNRPAGAGLDPFGFTIILGRCPRL